MQFLRGRTYVQDGAIQESCLINGRHQSEVDPLSWHLLILNSKNEVCGGARFREHPRSVALSDLTASHSALADSPNWSLPLKRSLESELTYSKDLDLPFVELGGWALDEEIRGTTEALRIALATYAFWQLLGGAICVSTATRRNCSASILRRIGGGLLEYEGRPLPAYFDPQYNCEMELLRFYSWSPNPRYAIWIEEMKKEFCHIPVIAGFVSREDFDFPQRLPARSLAASA
jgi:hypothetical protein